uniref:Uncharacterized protein n=1 Tax=Anopheles arabiensis TaxID=7173 RepID=A0A182IHL0_ANOAR
AAECPRRKGAECVIGPYQSTLLSTLPGTIPCLPNGWLGVFSVLFRCFLQHGESGRYVPKDCLAAAPTELTAVRAEAGRVLPGIGGSPLHQCASVYVCVCVCANVCKV